MTYLVVGVDESTLAPWHQNVSADCVPAAEQIALARASACGIRLVVAAVIGPGSTLAGADQGAT